MKMGCVSPEATESASASGRRRFFRAMLSSEAPCRQSDRRIKGSARGCDVCICRFEPCFGRGKSGRRSRRRGWQAGLTRGSAIEFNLAPRTLRLSGVRPASSATRLRFCCSCCSSTGMLARCSTEAFPAAAISSALPVPASSHCRNAFSARSAMRMFSLPKRRRSCATANLEIGVAECGERRDRDSLVIVARCRGRELARLRPPRFLPQSPSRNSR